VSPKWARSIPDTLRFNLPQAAFSRFGVLVADTSDVLARDEARGYGTVGVTARMKTGTPTPERCSTCAASLDAPPDGMSFAETVRVIGEVPVRAGEVTVVSVIPPRANHHTSLVSLRNWIIDANGDRTHTLRHFDSGGGLLAWPRASLRRCAFVTDK